jgi:ubiquinone/menaquinone biosynthesis C-methylase UbiE
MTSSSYQASDGAAYELFLGRWTKRLAEPLLDFAAFSTDGPLLDVGTGTGSLALAMAARWPSRGAVGLDIAKPYSAYAQSMAGPGTVFETGDAIMLPHGAAAFAGAAAQLVLNFVPDPLAAVGEMRRVTKSNGTIVAAVWV